MGEVKTLFKYDTSEDLNLFELKTSRIFDELGLEVLQNILFDTAISRSKT